MDNQRTLGDTAKIRFTSLGDTEVDAKVDSGATTSSLHADQIQAHNGQVSFRSKPLGDKQFTMDLVGNQEVHSADGGAQDRPMVKLDLEIDGTPLQGITFNLNDRSNMDTPVLLGQNVLKAGNFVVDVSKGGSQEQSQEQSAPEKQMVPNPEMREDEVMKAIAVLAEAQLTLQEFLELFRTEVVRRLK